MASCSPSRTRRSSRLHRPRPPDRAEGPDRRSTASPRPCSWLVVVTPIGGWSAAPGARRPCRARRRDRGRGHLVGHPVRLRPARDGAYDPGDVRAVRLPAPGDRDRHRDRCARSAPDVDRGRGCRARRARGRGAPRAAAASSSGTPHSCTPGSQCSTSSACRAGSCSSRRTGRSAASTRAWLRPRRRPPARRPRPGFRDARRRAAPRSSRHGASRPNQSGSGAASPHA